MFNARNLNTELFGRRHRTKRTDPRVPSNHDYPFRSYKHRKDHIRGECASEESSLSSESSDCHRGLTRDEIECCGPDPSVCCGARGSRKAWRHMPFFSSFHKHGDHHASIPCCSMDVSCGTKHCPFVSLKDMEDLPVKVRHGCVPICVRGMLMFHIMSETKPTITITNTGSIKVEADGIQLLDATLRENYPTDKVVASYANKIVTIRLPCDLTTCEPPVDIPITIQK